MRAIKHILFPIDFSARCLATTPFVASLAKRLEARVTLLNMVEADWNAPIMASPPIVDQLEEIQKGKMLGMRERLERQYPDLPVDGLVEVGDPAEGITRVVDSHEVDLVMLPTHGLGRFRDLLLGSVTTKVLHDCNRPVWTSAHIKDIQSISHVDPQNVLCAVDAGPKTGELLKSAALFADQARAKLRLVHVVLAYAPDRALDALFEKALVEKARRSIHELQKSLGITAPLRIVVPGSIASAIAEEAALCRADLVITGRGVLTEPLGRLRTHTCAIVQKSPCPVLSC